MALTQQSGFSFPMIQQGPQGRVRYTRQDTVSLINFSIAQILLTMPGERFWNPSFGSMLRKMQFENLSQDTVSTIKNIVVNAIKKWETRVTVKPSDVTVSLNPNSTGADDSTIVNISYSVNNPDFTSSATPQTVSVTF